jgi:glycosyltransferase involved in cell wall biosynthesis
MEPAMTEFVRGRRAQGRERGLRAGLVLREQASVKGDVVPCNPLRLFLPATRGRQGEGGLRTRGCLKCASNKWQGHLHKCQKYQNRFFPETEPWRRGADVCGDQLPLISILTVVYNGGKFLEKTIKSVTGQSYKHLEYIIIDGGSTDNTLEIIKRYEQSIDYWVSEPDSGIYDAMNKGISLVTGEWINFMNAGDQFFDQDTIKKVFHHHVGGDIIYGSTIFRYDSDNKKIRKPKQLIDFAHGLPFCHQSSFVKTSLHKNARFSAEYEVYADFDLFAGFLMKKREFVFKDIVISSVDYNGVSASKRIRRLRELCAVARKYNRFPLVVKLIADIFIRECLKIIIPLRFIRKIQMSK